MFDINEAVREFHNKFGVPVLDKPDIPHRDRVKLRIELIKEEFIELCDAFGECDVVGVADGLADLVYVVFGAAHECGIPLDDVLEEVHRSNMTKVWEDGTVSRREDGKILKPPTYSPPDIKSIIERNCA